MPIGIVQNIRQPQHQLETLSVMVELERASAMRDMNEGNIDRLPVHFESSWMSCSTAFSPERGSR
ncbi:MAG: hypothetical protein ACLPXB_05720 [Thiobacillaceae bacterium]